MYPRINWLDDAGHSHAIIVRDRVYLGRSCHGVPAAKRILIDDPDISRDHAVITWHDGMLTVLDTSRNGTRVNGVRATPGVEQVLCDQDTITAGTHNYTVQLPDNTPRTETKDAAAETHTLAIDEVVTHLVADVRDYSMLSQQRSPARVCALITQLFDTLSPIVHTYHGTIKDYAGDAIFAYWEHGPTPQAQAAQDACHAARAQLAACQELAARAARRGDADLAAIRIGWGIATGKVTLSHYGVRHDNVAVVGDATNLAFRLSGLANKDVASPIVLCQHTARLVSKSLPLIELGAVDTKGRLGKERIFGLADEAYP